MKIKWTGPDTNILTEKTGEKKQIKKGDTFEMNSDLARSLLCVYNEYAVQVDEIVVSKQKASKNAIETATAKNVKKAVSKKS